ncbi:Uncharacterised protein [uncultured archaeon]|nr:Uncharacterised protein [uncultured archaeon]
MEGAGTGVKLIIFGMGFATMKKLFIFAALFALVSACFAVNVISPLTATVTDGSQISVGNVGPGQTFAIVAEPEVATGGRYGLGGAYDQMSASELPYGWTSVPSKIYSNPLQTDITVPKDAPDGEYEVGLTLWDEAGSEGLGDNVTFTVKVTVTRDVMDMKVEPAYLSVGAGQPARYTITILNKGIANDVFTVSSSVVLDCEFRRSVYVPSGTSKTLTYEVVGNEEADYGVKILAKSGSSDAIRGEQDVQLRVNTDLFSDYRAVNRGLLLFPLTEAPVYFVTGLLSNLLPQ